MEPDFQSESWEQSGPSYVQSYVVSAFILIGFLGLASSRVPLTPDVWIFFTAWFGAFFYWLIQNRRAERTFASDRITVANGRVTHTFRYANPEAEHSDIPVDEITEIRVHSGTPIAVELIGSSDSDFFMLPNEDQLERLRTTLQRLNPKIRYIK